MDRLNDRDPLEDRLRKIPRASVPASVFDRLQRKASWNKPITKISLIPWLAILLLIIGLALAWFIISRPTGVISKKDSFPPPVIVASQPPVLASSNQEPDSIEDDPLENPRLRRQFREPTISGFGCETISSMEELLLDKS